MGPVFPIRPGIPVGTMESGMESVLEDYKDGDDVTVEWRSVPHTTGYLVAFGKWPWNYGGPAFPENSIRDSFDGPEKPFTTTVSGTTTATIPAASAGRGRFCWTVWPIAADPSTGQTALRQPLVASVLEYCYTTEPAAPQITVDNPPKKDALSCDDIKVHITWSYIPAREGGYSFNGALGTLDGKSPGCTPKVEKRIEEWSAGEDWVFGDIYDCKYDFTVVPEENKKYHITAVAPGLPTDANAEADFETGTCGSEVHIDPIPQPSPPATSVVATWRCDSAPYGYLVSYEDARGAVIDSGITTGQQVTLHNLNYNTDYLLSVCVVDSHQKSTSHCDSMPFSGPRCGDEGSACCPEPTTCHSGLSCADAGGKRVCAACPPMTAPTGLSPDHQPNAICLAPDVGAQPPQLSWLPVPHATSYVVRYRSYIAVANDFGNGVVCWSKGTPIEGGDRTATIKAPDSSTPPQSMAFLIPDMPHSVDTYGEWEVQAIGACGQSSMFSNTAVFHVSAF